MLVENKQQQTETTQLTQSTTNPTLAEQYHQITPLPRSTV